MKHLTSFFFFFLDQVFEIQRVPDTVHLSDSKHIRSGQRSLWLEATVLGKTALEA